MARTPTSQEKQISQRRRARLAREKRDTESGLEAWIAMRLDLQHDCCAICQRRFTDDLPYCIDHDHTCCEKKGCPRCWRGLLCVRCNSGIGFFEDTIRILAAAIVYLQDHEERNAIR